MKAMRIDDWKKRLEKGSADAQLQTWYGADADAKKARLVSLLDRFAAEFGGEREVCVLSVPGRSELAGNHTDHNHGAVIAASVDLDMIAVASARDDGVIRMNSKGFAPLGLTLADAKEPDRANFGTSASLVAGMINGFAGEGLAVGGFDAVAESDVLPGSGLSSSAAYEVAVGTILNVLYNGGKVSPVTVAKLSQRAENLFFGKPCGLMDQCACAVGGAVAIDFADPVSPAVEQIPFDLTGAGYALCIVDTGGNHADLTPEYAAIPAEMKSVAAEFGKDCLRQVDEAAFRAAIPALRKSCGDRAVLRALHFFSENKRVAAMGAALRKNDMAGWFAGVKASGASSAQYLQNVFATVSPREQGITLALNLCETLPCAAARVHGGGFAGTAQAYVPLSDVEAFRAGMEAVFGAGSCRVLHIRPVGAVWLEA